MVRNSSRKRPPAGGVSTLLAGYFNRAELAADLGVCQRSVARYEQNEGLPYITTGGRRMYHRAAIMAWLEARQA